MNRDFSCKESTSSRAILKRFRLGRFLRTVFIICSVMGFTGLAQVGHAQDLDGPAFFGNSPPVAGSSASLFFEEDIVNEQVFSWASSDPILGEIDTGVVQGVNIQRWLLFGSGPTRLVFIGSGDGATFYGNVLFEPYNRAVVDVVKGSKRIRYLLTVIKVEFVGPQFTAGGEEVEDPSNLIFDVVLDGIPRTEAELLGQLADRGQDEPIPEIPPDVESVLPSPPVPLVHANLGDLRGTLSFTTLSDATVDTMVAQFERLDHIGGIVSGTLTETDLNTLIFENATIGARVELPSGILLDDFVVTVFEARVELPDLVVQQTFIETSRNSNIYKTVSRLLASVVLQGALDPLRVDSIAVQFVDEDGNQASGTLSETAIDSLVFENDTITLRVIITSSTAISPEVVDTLTLSVDSIGLDVFDDVLQLNESSTDSLQFTNAPGILVSPTGNGGAGGGFGSFGGSSADFPGKLIELRTVVRPQLFKVRVTDPSKTEDSFIMEVFKEDDAGTILDSVDVTMIRSEPFSDTYLSDQPIIAYTGELTAAQRANFESDYYLLGDDNVFERIRAREKERQKVEGKKASLPIQVSKVEFHIAENNPGTNLFPLWDPRNGKITGDEYTRTHQAVDHALRNYAMFTLGYQFQVRATFVTTKLAGQTVKIKAKRAGKGNTTIGGLGEVNVTFGANGIGTAIFTINDAAPTKVGSFDTHWTWFAEKEGVEHVIGYSWHRILCGRKKPVPTVRPDLSPHRDNPLAWVAWWSCEWASGVDANTPDKDVVNQLFSQIANTASTGPAIKLQYVFPRSFAQEFSAREMLFRPLKGVYLGSCGHWSSFFTEICAAQGIQVNYRAAFVTPGGGATMTAFRTKNTQKDIDGDLGLNYGANNRRWGFGDHHWVEFGGNIYDPSFNRQEDNKIWEVYVFDLFDDERWVAGGMIELHRQGLEYLSKNPNYVTDYAHIQEGRCHAALGDTDKALHIWNEIIKAQFKKAQYEADVETDLYLVFELRRPLVLALKAKALHLVELGKIEEAILAENEIGKAYPGSMEWINLFYDMASIARKDKTLVHKSLRAALDERDQILKSRSFRDVPTAYISFELEEIDRMRKQLSTSQ